MSPKTGQIVKYVLPTTLSSVCIFLFTIVDGIFVGRGVGTNALGATNLALPFVMLVNALFMLATIGGVTITAIRLGRGDKEGAGQAFMNALYLISALSVALCAAGLFFTDAICTLLGANDTFRPMVRAYLFWYSIFLLPSGLFVLLQGFCRNDGSPMLVTAAVIVTTAFNVFGDWLLIFPLQMGLKGAAIATGASQVAGLIIMLTHFIRRRGALCFKAVRPQGALVGKVMLRGLPESIAQLSTPVTTLCMNLMLKDYLGDLGINIFSLISYVGSFAAAVFLGASEGFQPLFGQSYGAKHTQDLKYYLKSGLIIGVGGSVLINILVLRFGQYICALFGADQMTLQATVRTMPLYSWGFIVMAVNVMISAYLYSTKRSKEAIILNALRSFVLNTAVILLLPALLGGDAIWLAFGICEALSMIVGIALLKASERGGIVYK